MKFDRKKIDLYRSVENMLADELALTADTMKPQSPNLYNTYE
jgi:hypothetical protein